MARYLVTGGAGFIGSHLTENLVQQGHQVRVLDNLSSGNLENLKSVAGHFEWIQGNAADASIVNAAMKNIEGVFHMAAIPSVPLSIKEPVQNQHAGEVANLVVLTAAQRAGVRRVVHTSSSAVYGNTTTKQNSEELPPHPLNFYALSKLTGEGYCRIYSDLFPGFDTVSLRYFNVFGLRQDPSSPYSGVISIFLRCLKEKTAPTIFGDGSQSRDFVEVSNIVQANVLAMNSVKPLRGDYFNVGTGESVTILEVWEFLRELAGLEIKPNFAPERAGDIKNSCANIEKIQKTLGFTPSVRWRTGLEKLFKQA